MEKEALLEALLDYPFLYNSVYYDGLNLLQNKTCKKCISKDCNILLKQENKLNEYQCSKFFDNFLIKNGGTKIVLNGLILNTNKSFNKLQRKSFSRYKVLKQDVSIVLKKVTTILRLFEKEFSTNQDVSIEDILEENTRAKFALLHDVRTSFGLAFSITERLVYKQQGKDVYEKLRANKELSDLYSALELTNYQLNMIDIVNNPESISYDKKISSNIFQLFHKLSNLFKNKLIYKNGKHISWFSNKQIPDRLYYEAIILVPILLIDNAIKYSLPNSDIDITFDMDNYSNIIVTVKSYGYLVDDGEIVQCTEKFYRGENAKANGIKGMGIGLWMVNEILKAHNSFIEYRKEPISGEIGNNYFLFKIK